MSWCSLQPITGVFINLALMVKPYRHHATLSICRAWLVAVHTPSNALVFGSQVSAKLQLQAWKLVE
jgi:hypothetical protein